MSVRAFSTALLMLCCTLLYSQTNLTLSSDSLENVARTMYKREAGFPVQFDKFHGRNIYILKTNKSCLRCFHEIVEVIQSALKPADSVRIYCVTLCDSSISAMKYHYYENKSIMFDSVQNIFVFNTANIEGAMHSMPPQNSFFGIFGVTITPGLLLQNEGHFLYLDNSDMYVGTYLNEDKVIKTYKKIFRANKSN